MTKDENPTDFLHNHFPSVELGGGLFYSWPIGIRFELGWGRVPLRVGTVYEACFSSVESCMIVSQDWASDRGGKSGSRSLFSFATEIGLESPAGITEFANSDEDGGENAYTVKWALQLSRSFDYKTLFQYIANAEQGGSPAISSRVFFFNTEKEIILHMYDDRGFDVVASRRETISHIYGNWSDWILDFDRKRIDQVFNA